MLARYFDPRPELVFNNSLVIAARFRGTAMAANKSFECEILLDREISAESGSASQDWLCIGRPLRKLLPGTKVALSDDLEAQILDRPDTVHIIVRFSSRSGSAAKSMQAAGLMPIPPYIRDGNADDRDRIDYQPHLAKIAGSIAASTASLHFTPELFDALKAKGHRLAEVTLHLGTGSIKPVISEEGSMAAPAEERYIFDPRLIAGLKSGSRKVIAVGTSVVRALESMAGAVGAEDGQILDTGLFISPGFKFKLVDALITNFHMPGSSHLLLVEAFMGRELLDKSYQYALDNNFRFLSYGDGMLIV